jgi:hypothetical protein
VALAPAWVVPPLGQVVAPPPVGGDMEDCTGGRGSARSEAGLGGTTRTTARHWSRWAVVRCQLLIGTFKFKFDRLNMNSAA